MRRPATRDRYCARTAVASWVTLALMSLIASSAPVSTAQVPVRIPGLLILPLRVAEFQAACDVSGASAPEVKVELPPDYTTVVTRADVDQYAQRIHDVQIARHQENQNTAARDAAVAALRPLLTLSSGMVPQVQVVPWIPYSQGSSGANPGGATPGTWAGSLQASYTFSSGSNEAGVRKAEADLASAHAQVAGAFSLAYSTARQAYWKAHLATYQLAVALVAEACADKIEKETREEDVPSGGQRYKDLDVATASAKARKAKADVQDALNADTQAQDALRVALNRPARNVNEKIRTDDPREPLARPNLPELADILPALLKTAKTFRPDVSQADFDIASAQAALDKAAVGLRPSWTISLGPQLSNAQGVNGQLWPLGFPVQWAGLVSMTQTLYDGLKTPAQTEAQQQALNQARLKRQLLLDYTIERQVRDAYAALLTSAASYSAARDAVMQFTTAFTTVHDLRYGPKRDSSCFPPKPKEAPGYCKHASDVVSAFTDAISGISAVDKAQSNYEIAEAQLRQAIGCDWPIRNDSTVPWGQIVEDPRDHEPMASCDQPYLQRPTAALHAPIMSCASWGSLDVARTLDRRSAADVLRTATEAS